MTLHVLLARSNSVYFKPTCVLNATSTLPLSLTATCVNSVCSGVDDSTRSGTDHRPASKRATIWLLLPPCETIHDTAARPLLMLADSHSSAVLWGALSGLRSMDAGALHVLVAAS